MASESAASARAEKRGHRRLTVQLEVTWHVESTGDVGSAVATTLGAGGLFVPSERPLAKLTPIRVRFRLPGRETAHELLAHVVWANDSDTPGVPPSGRGMGIAFRDKRAQAQLIRELQGIPEERVADP